MAAEIIEMKDLCEALAQPLAMNVDTHFRVSDAILNIFKSSLHDSGLTPDMQRNRAVQRFNFARRLFQRITDLTQHAPPFAVLYRMDHRRALEDIYVKSLSELSKKFKEHIARLAAPAIPNTPEAVRNILTILRGESDVTEQQRHIIDYLLTLNDLSLQALQSSDQATIGNWFNSKVDAIKALSEKKFYGVEDIPTALQNGALYGPPSISDPSAPGGSITAHNWGLNLTWITAVALRGVPIRMISPMDFRGTQRHPQTQGPGPAPFVSANVLEISVALKMGYTINVGRETATLTPPPPERRADFPRTTTGESGNGILLTKQGQVDQYWRQALIQLKLKEMSEENPIHLQEHVHTVCTKDNEDAKIDLICTLEAMKHNNTITPILNNLQSREIGDLIILLETPRFNGERFAPLKIAARTRLISIMAADLIARVPDQDSLRDHIHNICQTGTKFDKENLIDALVGMEHVTRMNIINKLQPREIKGLHEIMSGKEGEERFKDARYAEIKVAVSPAVPMPIIISVPPSAGVGSASKAAAPKSTPPAPQVGAGIEASMDDSASDDTGRGTKRKGGDQKDDKDDKGKRTKRP